MCFTISSDIWQQKESLLLLQINHSKMRRVLTISSDIWQQSVCSTISSDTWQQKESLLLLQINHSKMRHVFTISSDIWQQNGGRDSCQRGLQVWHQQHARAAYFVQMMLHQLQNHCQNCVGHHFDCPAPISFLLLLPFLLLMSLSLASILPLSQLQSMTLSEATFVISYINDS